LQTKRLFFALLAGMSLATVIGAGAALILPSSDDSSRELLFNALAVAVGGATFLLSKRRDGLSADALQLVAMLLFATAVAHLLKLVLVILEHAAQGLRQGLGTIVTVRILGSLLLFAIFFWLATRNQNHKTGGA
jgi:cytochrome bd-type quinol oxidase subunit 2